MSVTTREWRACARDDGDTGTDHTQWTTEPVARAAVSEFTDCDPPYDEVWLEYRDVLYTAPKRVPDHVAVGERRLP